MSDLPTLYRQAWELNEHAPNAVYTVDHIGVYYEGYLVPVEPNLDGMRRAWDSLAPCVCGPEYTERNLESPHCWNHVTRGELLDLWNGALEVTDDE